MASEEGAVVNASKPSHAGHEGLHEGLFWLIMVSIIGTQILLLKWKTWHYTSYQISTLGGLAIMPIIYSVVFSWNYFLAFLLLYMSANAYVLYLASRPLDLLTPKRIYSFFFIIYKLTSYIAGGAWAILLFSSLLNLSGFLLALVNIAMLVSLYVAVLNRDFAEFCTSQLARRLGYGGKGLPTRAAGTACLCRQEIDTTPDALPGDVGRRLPCGHVFHDWCLRGWLIIGKQDVCPHCSEKVNIKELFANPWDKPSHLW